MKPKEIVKVHFTMRLDETIHQKVKELAAKNRRSLNNQIECMLEQQLEK